MQAEPRRERAWLWVALAFLLFWICYLYFFSPRNRRGDGSFTAGRAADVGWEMQDLNGEPVSLSRYRGKAVFLNVWATWCGPCVSELPSIAQLAQHPALKDVVFLCVSVDEDPETVRKFVKQHGPLPMTVVWSKGSVPSVFQSEGIPTTFLIGPDGRIASREVGSRDWNDSRVVKRLESLASTLPMSF